MIKAVTNKLMMFIYFIVGTLLLEVVTFHILGLSAMPTYFWYNFVLILFVALVVYAIPNYTAQYVVYTIILFLQTIFAYLNYSLSNIYGDLFSFDMFNLAKEAGAAIATNFIYFSIILQLLSIYAIIAIFGFMCLRKCRADKLNVKQHFSIYNVIIMLIFECCSLGYFMDRRAYFNATASITDENFTQSDSFLMNSQFLKNISYERFGTYGYFANILIRQIRGYDDSFKKATMEYFNIGEMYDGTFINEQGETVSNDVFGVDSGNNVIVIMMESLEWFGFGDGNYDSQFNNLSSELTPNVYALIYGEDCEIDVDNSNLDNDAIISKNFFAKSKTNISEGFGIIGSYPVGETLASIVKNDELTYSMPSILSKLGYTTTYLHSNEISFYNRDKTHPNLGFDRVVGKDNVTIDGKKVYSKDDLKWNHWDNEEDFIKYTMDYLIPTNYEEKPFYSFYLNVSSHGPYTEDGNEYDQDYYRYRDYVVYGKDNCELNASGNWVVKAEIKNSQTKTNDEGILVCKDTEIPVYSNWYQNVLKNYHDDDPDLCNELIYYECGVVGLDSAIGRIVAELNTKTYADGTKLIDKTTLLLYSDHNSYYDKMSNRVKGIPESDFSSIKLNTIPMILSSPGIKEYNKTQSQENKYLVNTRFTSAYDIIPTLFDLLGVKFNQNLYVGSSIFKPADYVYKLNDITYDMLIYYSNTGGIFSRDVYTYNFSDFYTERRGVSQETIELFEAQSYQVLKKINYLFIFNHYHLYVGFDKIYQV